MSAPTIPAEKTHLTREEINRKQKEYIFLPSRITSPTLCLWTTA